MADILLTMVLCFAVYWFSGLITEAEIAEQCIHHQAFKADAKHFACLIQED